MAASISGSVGQGGVNKPDDVATIQTLLNGVLPSKLKVDKQCGPRTIQAIRDFQKSFLSASDGRVDPGGTTWKKLMAGRVALVLLPPVCGDGYYPISSMDRQYGTPDTIRTLQDVAGQFRIKLPHLPIGIGDISFAAGGAMIPHQSHRRGTNVDIRPLRQDARMDRVAIGDPQYSKAYTQLLVESLLAHRNVRRILFNDTSIPGVHYFAGHNNHLHVEMTS